MVLEQFFDFGCNDWCDNSHGVQIAQGTPRHRLPREQVISASNRVHLTPWLGVTLLDGAQP